MGYQPQQPEFDPEEEHWHSEADDENAPTPAPQGTADLVGRTLAGRYRFDALIGEGSFARVYRVHDRHRRADLAAKVLRSDIAQEPAFMERFRREAAVLSRLQHPHIVRYYDIVELDNVVFILTDYIQGQTLQNVLRQRGKPLTPFESLEYLAPLAAALHFAHQESIIHRDLKPANILIDANGDLYVTDFGIARILSDASTLTMDMSVGTPHFMSPEQIMAAEVTVATDIYALGVMLYQMYTGQLPFTGDSPDAQGTTAAVRIAYEHLHVKPQPPSDLNPRISRAVEAVVMRCLDKDPEQRYASVSEMYEALTDAIGTPSVSLNAQQLKPPASHPAPASRPAAPAGQDIPLATDYDVERVPTGVPAFGLDDKPKRGRKRKRDEHPDWMSEVSEEMRGAVSEVRREIARERRQGEKQREKEREAEEKDREKGTEKESEKADEKGDFWADVAPSDRLSQFTWGGVVLWAGIVFLLNSIGVGGALFSQPWSWILAGSGAMLLFEVAIRLRVPEFRTKPGARLMLGMILLFIGLGTGFGFAVSLWPLILVAIGVSLLLNHLSG